MNDVMKKRLIGVAIIIAIGVLVPVLLSQCMGSNDSGEKSGEMRVYTVDPDGQATRESDDDDSEQGPDMPDAVSPQRDDSADDAADSNEEEFETPPVSGGQSGSSDADDSAEAEANRSEPETASEPNQRQQQREPQRETPAEREPAPEPKRAAPASSNSGSDYGASTQGRASGATRSQSSSNNSGSQSGLSRASISGWVVQVGSFSERSNASDLARQLSGSFTASYTPATIDGRTLYRVNVGPFANEGQARSAADRLSQQGRQGLVRNLP